MVKSMGIAYLCVLIAALLPYAFVAYTKFSGKGYNNNNPREFAEKTEGKLKRAYFAHLNSFEAFGPFAASVIIAQISGVSADFISTFAVVFIFFRILYGYLYIQDKASLRSLAWFAGFACVLLLFIAAIDAATHSSKPWISCF